jgi:ferredoxin
MSYVARIDESSCIAQGDCVELAPQAFRLDDHAVAIGGAPDEEMMAAAEGCPVEAIALLDADSGEQVYP